eukprot:m.242468 g.242468  ORF g.242468 m.242468 type:complete len:70 (+) comp15330_c0_seq80:323-532(+)
MTYQHSICHGRNCFFWELYKGFSTPGMQWVFVCSVDVGQDYIPLGQPAAFLYTTTAICSKELTTRLKLK